MSGLELALRNLASWSLQAGALALAAAALARLLPIERPGARLAGGQALLAATLALPLLQPWRAVAATTDSRLSLGATSPSTASAAADALASPLPAWWATPIAGLLAAGVGFRLLRLASGLAGLRLLRRRSRPLPEQPWLIALRTQLAPRASIRLADGECSPATFGARRPVVLLPASFASLDRERQQPIVLHELIHARRFDWPVLLLEELLKAVLFFHPAVHWLLGRIRLAREQCVDAEVVHALRDRQIYLESLVEAARRVAHARAVPAASFLRESHLRERVDLLLKEVLMSRPRTLVHLGLSATALVLTAAWAATAFPLESEKPAAAATAPAASLRAHDHKAAAPGDPKLLHRVEPTYPADARAEKVEGVFRISITIGTDGAIRAARVVRSAPTLERLAELEAQADSPAAREGDERLAKAALEAIGAWRYQPIMKDGKAVEAKATVTVRFALG